MSHNRWLMVQYLFWFHSISYPHHLLVQVWQITWHQHWYYYFIAWLTFVFTTTHSSISIISYLDLADHVKDCSSTSHKQQHHEQSVHGINSFELCPLTSIAQSYRKTWAHECICCFVSLRSSIVLSTWCCKWPPTCVVSHEVPDIC